MLFLSWHVLSRKNVLKVREDEAEARRIEAEKARRATIAEQEARIALMRSRTRAAEPKDLSVDRHSVAAQDEETSGRCSPPKHINFFEDVKTGVSDLLVLLKCIRRYKRERAYAFAFCRDFRRHIVILSTNYLG